MIIEIILSIIIPAGVVLIIFYLAKDRILNIIEDKIKGVFKEKKEELTEQYRTEKELLEEKMKRENQFIENKKDSIKELVDKIYSELAEDRKKLEHTEKERIGEFSTLKAVLEEYKIVTGGLKNSTDDLKNILSNNQARGKYGEEIAENLLKSVGFVKDINYTANKRQDTVLTKPDFTMFLPDKTKINIDVKFPYQSLLRYQETDDKQEKEKHLRQFAVDVKEKIKQVATRDYINPEEKTVDFVILFVPNEMIFSFIYDHLTDVWNEAMKKKVIMVGPFSFVAILRMVFQSYRNFKYQENLYEIIKLIKMFEQEYEKFDIELDALGKRILSVSAQYQNVSITRTKKLSGIVERIRGENILPEIQEEKGLEKPTIQPNVSRFR